MTQTVTHTEIFQRLIAGKEHQAQITLLVKPGESNEGNTFVSQLSKARLPQSFQLAVERGVKSAFNAGVLLGYPIIDINVELVDAEFNELNASELAFEAVGALGFDNAVRKAQPIQLEPIMKVIILSPRDFVGEVISYLTQKNGIVLSIDNQTSYEQINSHAPLNQMFGFSTGLRSLTQGRGTFHMEFSHFACKQT